MSLSAIVSGGTRGIGLATAKTLLEKYGYTSIGLFSRNMHDECFESMILGEKCKFYACDLQIEESIKSAVEQFCADFALKSPKVLINCAGVVRNQLLIKENRDDIFDTMDVNLIGTMALTRECLRKMIKAKVKRPTIVNVSSAVAIVGNSGQSAYGASKAALLGFTRCLAEEMGTRDVRVYSVIPGFTHTSMVTEIDSNTMSSQIPLNRFAKVEEIALPIAWLAEERKLSSGSELIIDGGFTTSLIRLKQQGSVWPDQVKTAERF